MLFLEKMTHDVQSRVCDSTFLDGLVLKKETKMAISRNIESNSILSKSAPRYRDSEG